MKEKISKGYKKIMNIKPGIYFVIMSIFTFFLVEILNDTSWFFEVDDKLRIFFMMLNLIFYYVMYIFMYAVTGSVKFSSVTGLLVFNIVAIINYFVCIFRGVAFRFSDIFSAQTAANVISMYEFKLSKAHFVWAILLILAIVYVSKYIKELNKQKTENKRLWRIPVSVTGLALLIGAIFIDYSDMGINSFDGWNVGGYALYFWDSISTYTIEEPNEYDSANYNDVGKVDVNAKKTPNIVVIMNESFCDIDRIADIETSQEVLPFFHQFVQGDNIVEGEVYVNAYAGNTVNTEMEFLTCSTMGFWGKDNVCYTMGYSEDLNIVPNWMQQLGYSTIAMHPAVGRNYSRNIVYDRMQFQKKMFINEYLESGVDTISYPNASYFLKDMVNDSEDYELVGQIVEQEEKPVFIFNATIQNHGGYEWRELEDVKIQEEIKDEQKEAEINEYLSLLKQSDEALEKFITEVSQWEEDTIILFFGDHQPNVTLTLYEELSLDMKNKDFYKVPFFVWANYEISTEHNVQTSANYLQNILFKTSGIGLLNEYQKYIETVRDEYPILSPVYTVDKNGEGIDFATLLEKSELIQEYHKKSYKLIYDSGKE